MAGRFGAAAQAPQPESTRPAQAAPAAGHRLVPLRADVGRDLVDDAPACDQHAVARMSCRPSTSRTCGVTSGSGTLSKLRLMRLIGVQSSRTPEARITGTHCALKASTVARVRATSAETGSDFIWTNFSRTSGCCMMAAISRA